MVRFDFDDRTELLTAARDIYYVTDQQAGANSKLERRNIGSPLRKSSAMLRGGDSRFWCDSF